MKITIKELLITKNVKAENIFFWSLERNNAKEFHEILLTYLQWVAPRNDERKYIFLDEICSIPKWSKELIYFANNGSLENTSVMVTGSHSMDLKYSTELMPGRREGGKEDPIDMILLPMKFSELVHLLWPDLKKKLFDIGLITKADRQKVLLELFEGKISNKLQELLPYKRQLDQLFETYMLTGGIPSVINEYQETKKISTKLFNIYLTAIIGDLRRFKFKEEYFKQIMREVFSTITTPITWNSFTKRTAIGSHNTVKDYIEALEDLFVLNVVYRYTDHDKRIHHFNKKLYVQDPFIFHALHGWAFSKKDYFTNAKANLLNIEVKSNLVENIVHNHITRFVYGLNPRDLFDPKDIICYYQSKRGKEIDFVFLYDEKEYPIEVKFQNQIKGSDFANFGAFRKGVMVTKDELGLHRHYAKIPCSMFLMLV